MALGHMSCVTLGRFYSLSELLPLPWKNGDGNEVDLGGAFEAGGTARTRSWGPVGCLWGTPLHCPWDPGHGDREAEDEVENFLLGQLTERLLV